MARLLKATAILLASAQVRGDATSLLRGEGMKSPSRRIMACIDASLTVVDAVKAAVPADFVEFRWPNPEDADRPELVGISFAVLLAHHPLA